MQRIVDHYEKYINVHVAIYIVTLVASILRLYAGTKSPNLHLVTCLTALSALVSAWMWRQLQLKALQATLTEPLTVRFVDADRPFAFTLRRTLDGQQIVNWHADEVEASPANWNTEGF